MHNHFFVTKSQLKKNIVNLVPQMYTNCSYKLEHFNIKYFSLRITLLSDQYAYSRGFSDASLIGIGTIHLNVNIQLQLKSTQENSILLKLVNFAGKRKLSFAVGSYLKNSTSEVNRCISLVCDASVLFTSTEMLTDIIKQNWPTFEKSNVTF